MLLFLNNKYLLLGCIFCLLKILVKIKKNFWCNSSLSPEFPIFITIPQYNFTELSLLINTLVFLTKPSNFLKQRSSPRA
jgi:hypothetical protein